MRGTQYTWICCFGLTLRFVSVIGRSTIVTKVPSTPLASSQTKFRPNPGAAVLWRLVVHSFCLERKAPLTTDS